ncbi:HERC2 [Symbiodinium natans]|uniref:NAD(P)(+)--arginine ADP-ribosyltransferase n=1 Tax=Symbiodinium natans TaxID=878477 RepID=A0A812M216_9DINO|nr:HERC2 [Symbiodinium natans]
MTKQLLSELQEETAITRVGAKNVKSWLQQKSGEFVHLCRDAAREGKEETSMQIWTGPNWTIVQEARATELVEPGVAWDVDCEVLAPLLEAQLKRFHLPTCSATKCRYSSSQLLAVTNGPSGHKLLGKGAHGIEVRASWTPNAAEASMVAPQASFVPLPRPTASSAPRGRRSHQRWADGLESVDAGRRDFFPAGWVPSKAVAESIQTLGYSPLQCGSVMQRASAIAEELREMGMGYMSMEHSAAVLAYTQEEDPCLYMKLNASMRSQDPQDERRLKVYLDYIYHLTEALALLPAYAGAAYRGTSIFFKSGLYEVGKKITWQAFTSTTRDQLAAISFLQCESRKLSGTLFVLEVKSGRRVEAISEFVEEKEVLVSYNSFWEVTKIVTSPAEKAELCDDLSAYNLSDLDVYCLKQL